MEHPTQPTTPLVHPGQTLPPKPLQLKVGRYKMRNGQIVKIEHRTEGATIFPWIGCIEETKQIGFWSDDGSFGDDNRDKQSRNIVAPYVEPTLRPWFHTEVPVGAVIRYKNNSSSTRMLIVSSGIRGNLGSGGSATFEELLENFEYSLDHGKTWKPCGVLEGGE